MNIDTHGWKGHTGFGLLAFHSLPMWEQRLVAVDLSETALDRPYWPKGQICTPGDKMGYLCTIMDLVYYDECRPYATLPDGKWIPHSPPDEKGQASINTGAQACPTTSIAILDILLDRSLSALRAGDWESFIRHAGALGHYVQEPFTPGHAVNNNLFHELFPDPDPQQHIRLHHAFDAATNDFDPLPPMLMGTTIGEVAYRLQLEIDRGVRDGKWLIEPIIRSVYDGKPREYREALLREQSRRATWATASAWHSLFCIGFDRIDPKEVDRIESIDLTTVVPYFWHHCKYVSLLPGCLVENQRKIPIHVWTLDGKAQRIERHVTQGFGMGGHMACKFLVDGRWYPHFRCRVGLPSRLTEGQSQNTNTTFSVQIDRQLNREFSEDMLYYGQTVFEQRLLPGAPEVEIDVDIREARSMIFITCCEPYTNSSGNVCFEVPHVAVCEPRLEKN